MERRCKGLGCTNKGKQEEIWFRDLGGNSFCPTCADKLRSANSRVTLESVSGVINLIEVARRGSPDTAIPVTSTQHSAKKYEK